MQFLFEILTVAYVCLKLKVRSDVFCKWFKIRPRKVALTGGSVPGGGHCRWFSRHSTGERQRHSALRQSTLSRYCRTKVWRISESRRDQYLNTADTSENTFPQNADWKVIFWNAHPWRQGRWPTWRRALPRGFSTSARYIIVVLMESLRRVIWGCWVRIQSPASLGGRLRHR